MKSIRIEIGSKEYTVKIARSDEELKKGLQGVTDLPKDEGMLFVFDHSDTISMWMQDTLIPLDIIFINEDLEVVSVYEGKPKSEDLFEEDNIAFVLELNANSGVTVNDTLEFNPDKKINESKMIVLDSEGKAQMELEGGERIFSRANTKTLIKFAKKAVSTELDRDYRELGKRVFKFIKTQDNNGAEYVELKN